MSFSIVYALIARGKNIILTDYSSFTGNFKQISLMMLNKITSHTLGEIQYDNNFTFYFEKEKEITYMCLILNNNKCNIKIEVIYSFLYDLKNKFLNKYSIIDIQKAITFQLGTFSSEIKPIVNFYDENNSYYKTSAIQKLNIDNKITLKREELIEQSEIIELKAERDEYNYTSNKILLSNFDCCTGEIEETLHTKTYKNYKKINKDKKIKIYIIVIIIICILFLFSVFLLIII